MPLIERPGATLHFSYQLGQEPNTHKTPCITLLNGHRRPSTDFRSLCKSLAAQGFHTLCIDQRGSGETRVDRAFSHTDMLADVVGVWDHLAIERTHVLGISMGGIFGQLLAHSASSTRIDKLILVSTAGCKEDLSESPDFGDTIESALDALKHYVSEQYFDTHKPLLRAMAKSLIASQDVSNQDVSYQESQEASDSSGVPNFAAIANQRDCMLDAIEKLKDCNFEGPVLSIHGEKDRIISPSAQHKHERRYPNCTRQSIPNAGHLLLAETHQVLKDATIEFLSAASA